MDKIKYILIFALIYLILRQLYCINYLDKEKYNENLEELEELETNEEVIENIDEPLIENLIEFKVSTLNSTFNDIYDIKIDLNNNIYINQINSDKGCIKKIDTQGNVTTIVSNISLSYCGITLDRSGNIYTTAWYNNGKNIIKITQSGSITVLYPNPEDTWDLQFDSIGNLYCISPRVDYVSKIDKSGNVTRVGSNFYQITGGAFDTFDNLYVISQPGGTVHKITPSGTVSLFASNLGGGPTKGVFDSSNNLYITNTFANVIQMIDTSGKINIIAGILDKPGSSDGSNFSAKFNWPIGISIDSNKNLYITEQGNNTTIRKIEGIAGVPFINFTPPPTTITLTDSVVIAGQPFTVNNTGTTSATTATWALNGTIIPGGSVKSQNFTAPTSPGVYNITCTIQGIIGTSRVTVNAITVTLSGPSSVSAGQTFTVNNTGTTSISASATWSLNGTTIPGGTITNQNFTAPTNPGKYTINCTVLGVTGTTTVTVNPTVTLSVPPSVIAGQTFTINNTGTTSINASATWSLNGTTIPGGTITSQNFTAPSSPGKYTITCTVQGVIGTTSVTVTPVIITLSGPSSVIAGQAFTVNNTGTTSINATAKWSLDKTIIPGDSIKSQNFTAPSTAGTYTITCNILEFTGSYTVTVNPIIITLSGPSSVIAGQAFTVNNTGTSSINATAKWLLDKTIIPGDSITSQNFTAPNTVGTYTITCNILEFTGKYNVTVNPITVTLTGPSSVIAGQSFTVNATGDWTSTEGAIWALNGVANNLCTTSSCVFVAPSIGGTVKVTYTVLGFIGSLDILVNPVIVTLPPSSINNTGTIPSTGSVTTQPITTINQASTTQPLTIAPTSTIPSTGSVTTQPLTIAPTSTIPSTVNPNTIKSPSNSVSEIEQRLIAETSTVLQNLSNTTNPEIISNTLNNLSSTLQSQNISSSIPITDPEIKSTIYSYYALTNPTLDTTLPLVTVSTKQDSNGNQIIDPESLPVNSSTSTNIIIPLDPGKSIIMNSVAISRGSLSDGTNINQSNQIQINDGPWLNYNEKVTIGNNIFLFVGSGSPIIMQILPASQSNTIYYIIGIVVVLVLIVLYIIYSRNSNNKKSSFDKYGE